MAATVAVTANSDSDSEQRQWRVKSATEISQEHHSGSPEVDISLDQPSQQVDRPLPRGLVAAHRRLRAHPVTIIIHLQAVRGRVGYVGVGVGVGVV